MLYSSGTTGRPKGIKHKLEDQQLRKALAGDWLSFFAFDPASVYLSPAPLYHAAPLRFSVRCVAFGGTVVLMRRFDAEGALAAIARWRVTHSQWVPTMFIRLLALPAERRAAHDLSSHRLALHAAAPCPIEVKRRMIDWWGPIVWEYYTGSERAGATAISAPEWLAHPGSVGRAKQGVLHIVGDDACELIHYGMELVRAGRTVQDVTTGMYSAVTFHELYQIAARAALDPAAARERRRAAGAAWAKMSKLTAASSQRERRQRKGQ